MLKFKNGVETLLLQDLLLITSSREAKHNHLSLSWQKLNESSSVAHRAFLTSNPFKERYKEFN